MGNLKTCKGCNRDLPRSMYPRQKELCFNCTFNGPGDKEDVMPSVRPVLPLNKNENDEEEVYVKHETEVINYIKKSENGLSTKELHQLLDLSKDALYQLCTKLVQHGKLEVSKEQRGQGKAQNIYSIPAVQGYMKHMEEEEVVQSTPNTLQQTSLNVKPSWDELKNKLILNGDCGEALKIMVEMEEEASK